MINNEYFDTYHGSRDNAPDGLIDRSNVMLDVVNILEHLYEMKPYTRRGPALTGARISEYICNNQDAPFAFAIIMMRLLRSVVDNDPTQTVASHLLGMFDSDFLHKLQSELSVLPYRSIAVESQVELVQCEDYSVLSLLCDRFPLEHIVKDLKTDDQDLRYEIIDEADMEPDADEDEDGEN
jgi:hypothetical protein